MLFTGNHKYHRILMIVLAFIYKLNFSDIGANVLNLY
ncbi:hypothetical protein B0I21_106206 [Sphingobacterium paludis]|uniref:Uncharacterized protein n=1 Tax=Sphingobacterium paludis TaxID=1476465 RepID=A0A4V3E1E4_9SPHI|nr:hypothetical protein B0I21_106206 [Sphingobacterium paludis]